jgi:cytochrome c556
MLPLWRRLINFQEKRTMQSRLKLVAGLMLAGIAVSAQAQTKPETAIEYRQGIFRAQLWNVLPMAAMVQGKAPYDQAAFLLRAQRLDQLSRMAWDGFGPGTDKGAPTKAKPDVWSNPARFKQAAEAFQAETPKLVAAAQSGNMDQIKAAFGAVTKSCDNCHDTFRSK